MDIEKYTVEGRNATLYMADSKDSPLAVLNNRMSATGITVIEDGAITEDFYSLVNPETHFDYFNTRLTGINEETVRDAPTFPGLWTKAELKGLLGNEYTDYNLVFASSSGTPTEGSTINRLFSKLISTTICQR